MKVLFIGDSNTLGPNLLPEQYYPARLSALCPEVEAVNLGVPGSRVGDWLPFANLHWNLIAAQLPADRLCIMLGSNDANPAAPTDCLKYIGSIVALIENFAGPVSLITPPRSSVNPFVLSLYAYWVRALAASHRLASLGADPHLVVADADYLDVSHLNALGQEKVAIALATSLRALGVS